MEFFKEHLGVILAFVSGLAAFFTLKGDVRLLQAELDTFRSKPKVDLSQVHLNQMAIQRLELSNAASDEQRKHLLDLVAKTQETMEKQADKQDQFQAEMLKGLTKLSTELQERTKALHST